MALRAMFFMEKWEDFLDKAEYPKAKHFLLHEACDITRILIHGLLKLIMIYHDHLNGVYPFLPWLLSTEVCKHVFALCRQIIKDFTMLDFHFMVPKLFVRLREATLFSRFSDGKARANGYNHTYTDNRNIDLVALSTFPPDDDIDKAARRAYEGAESLWTILGVPPSHIPFTIPSVRSWFTQTGPDVQFSEQDIQKGAECDSDYESGVDDGENDNEEDSEGAQLQQALDQLENSPMKSIKEDEVINSLAFAAVVMSVEDSMQM
jgi:hypothetical protein